MGKELWERVRLDDAIVTRLGHLRSAASKHRLFFMLALVLTYLDQINERGR